MICGAFDSGFHLSVLMKSLKEKKKIEKIKSSD